MAVSTGFNAVLQTLTGGTCSTTNDQISVTGGTWAAIGFLDTYTLNDTIEQIDVTAFGDKVRKNVPSFPGFTLSMSGSYDYANAGQKSFWDEVHGTAARATRVFRILEAGSATTVKGYTSGASAGSSVGGKSTFSAEVNVILIPKTTTAA